MYVIPYCMGPLDAESPMFGVELTDSPYVVASMHIMTRMGSKALDAHWARTRTSSPVCTSVGAPLDAGEQDVPWPCNDDQVHLALPEERVIWSYGSGYGGNALLGKKCYSLRIASVKARDEGWLAEHMLILKLTSPARKVYYVAAAFPSACGKTNLAMLEPTIPGWKVETLGDDIAWMRFGEDGRLYALNPEYGFFGVAPGTGWNTNANAMRTIEQGNSIFTNVALTDDGDVWWEGMTERAAGAPDRLEGPRLDAGLGRAVRAPELALLHPGRAVPDHRAGVGGPARACRSRAIFFGGRRRTTIPLVTESRDWQHGVFLGATLSSETTAAATGAVGVVRRDPMAMLPFIGYNAGDYFGHWISVGKSADASKLPRIFYVNWFRRDADGRFLWPGFGENIRVLKWAIERIEGTAAAVETPVGYVPAAGALDVSGLDLDPADLDAVHGGRRRGVAGRAAADRGVVRQDRRAAADRHARRTGSPPPPPRLIPVPRPPERLPIRR